jgi:hypothetical protein
MDVLALELVVLLDAAALGPDHDRQFATLLVPERHARRDARPGRS